ncbi:MAG TPA: RDD family protein [Xanthobacteraceae bacterium]|nr:RDD family protein [Xanthobacteraceae bacterium]
MTTTDAAANVLRREWRKRREIVTPEAVPLTVELAEFSERAIALLIDLVILFVAIFVLLFMLAFLTVKGLSGVVFVGVLMLVLFFSRVVYFIHFELTARGATPGKRAVGIRVVDRRGGPLQASAVIARNLTREIEIFLPLSMLISAGGGGPGVHWGYLLLLGWMICFLALMFFNRDRMRAGDLIAGTMVIALPRQRLLGDLVEARARFVFADDQLEAYGKRELQVLEDLLRRPNDRETQVLLRDVADRICRKIAWPQPLPPADTVPFLRDFYTAQRAFLEREQLFGRPRADKFEAAAKRD